MISRKKKMKEISQSALTTFSQNFREINEFTMKLLIAFSRNCMDDYGWISPLLRKFYFHYFSTFFLKFTHAE